MVKFPLRTDEYGRNFYIVQKGNLKLIPFKTGEYTECGIDFSVNEEFIGNVLKISVSMSSKEKVPAERFGFRLGIDTYMDTYPQWNEKFFPTALRCEKTGFWSCFMSPEGKMISVCSPSKIVSWKNEYNKAGSDVGHRIYTSSVEFINTAKQPSRHPENTLDHIPCEPLKYELFYSFISNESELLDFVEKYTHIHIPKADKFTLEKEEKLIIDGKEYGEKLNDGLNVLDNPNNAQLSVFVRKDWFYYLERAAENARVCQQKPGTHCESWYGFFTMVEYAKIIKDQKYTKALCDRFDSFFSVITKGFGKKRFRKKALPYRLQNASAMISLLTDFYELTKNQKYLDYADDMADWLMKLQNPKDGSYRSHKVHYTCVIYPAKSMLELAATEKAAGFVQRSKKHFASAEKAIENLAELMDDIATEGQMTFEDGMISCESLQLAFLALMSENKKDKKRFGEAAEIILGKHRCLEQRFLPDCRVRGCTLRFWEARYDINFFANMLNCPHGWTSWKNYASYYLYLLTGNLYYLHDLMDTMGACMQCVDDKGELNWAFIADPCVSGLRLKKGCTKDSIAFEESVVGEEYLPMISDWFRHDEKKLIFQYIRYINAPSTWKKDYGGSCDNDVHEHFKCLCETVFGKAFIHEKEDGSFEKYNCSEDGEGFICKDPHLKALLVYSEKKDKIIFNGKEIPLTKGLNKFETDGLTFTKSDNLI